MRLAAIFAILLVTLANVVSADVFKFGKVELKRENNSPGNWTQLEFKITDPKIGWRGYRGKREIFITLDTSFRNVTRTDIGFLRLAREALLPALANNGCTLKKPIEWPTTTRRVAFVTK